MRSRRRATLSLFQVEKETHKWNNWHDYLLIRCTSISDDQKCIQPGNGVIDLFNDSLITFISVNFPPEQERSPSTTCLQCNCIFTIYLLLKFTRTLHPDLICKQTAKQISICTLDTRIRIEMRSFCVMRGPVPHLTELQQKKDYSSKCSVKEVASN